MLGKTSPFIRTRHAWTKVDVPWDMSEDRNVGNARFGWRLFHYLRGGGLKAFGSTSLKMMRERRQSRFLALSAVLFVLWLVGLCA